MYVFLFYLLALLATCTYLFLFGGRTGRWLAGIQLVMAIVSAVVSYTAPGYVELQPRMLAIDTVSLALKLAVALASQQRWPIWVAAFQFNTVLAQGALLLSPAFQSDFYYAISTIWAIPTLFVMAVGVMLDRRALRVQVS